MNTQIIITASTFVGAGRQSTSSLAVFTNPLTASSGTSLGRVRTVSGNASKHMFERWQFHTARSTGPSDLKRVRTVNKKAGRTILNRRKAHRAGSTKVVSSVLGGLRKLASLGPRLVARSCSGSGSDSGDNTVFGPAVPCTPRRSARISSPPPLEPKKRTRACPLVDIEPVKLFPEYRDSKKARAKGLAACVDNNIPKLWVAAAF